jgi:small GTP-binding protein
LRQYRSNIAESGANMGETNNFCVLVAGKESVGKSQLISKLTGRNAQSSNFRGTTVSCDVYDGCGFSFVDTPGIVRQSDSATTKTALARLKEEDLVLLVVQATHIDQDLDDLLPLVGKKRGVIAVTFWDKIAHIEGARATLDRLSGDIGVPLVPIDTRKIGDRERSLLLDYLRNPKVFQRKAKLERAGWHIEPPRTPLDLRIIGPILAILLLLAPAIAAVWIANSFAETMDASVQALTAHAVSSAKSWPVFLQNLLVGRYGFITMGPLMFVWAVPTVIAYAFFLGTYKATGLIDRINIVMDPLLRPIGISGRDLVRVVMGFGCNVPAVINTRACSACSRGACISAIAFGSACSYQLGATLAVFGAAKQPWLVVPYLFILITSTLIYVRFTSPKEARSKLNVLMVTGRNFIERPRLQAIGREVMGTMSHFFRRAIPIFFAITLIASLLDWAGMIGVLASGLRPAMALFRLPDEAALAVIMASIRKDGILLFAEAEVLQKLSPWQTVTAVYLGSVFLPCLVTVFTIAREQSAKFATGLLLRHVVAALVFTMIVGWGGVLMTTGLH